MHIHLPPLNTLNVFNSAASLKSFKQTAEELHVTPTAVSHQIKSLEEALKTSLFERKTRAIELTVEGEKLAEVTHMIFQQLTNVVNEISNNKNVVTVSTTSSFASMWLIPSLEKFYAQHPNIEVAVKTGEELVNLEKDKRIDLAIRYGVYDESEKDTIPLVTEEAGTYATPSYLSKVDISKEINLLETKWQNKSLPSISWRTLLNGTNSNIKTNIRQFDQENHVIQAALADQGVALVSSLLVDNALKQGWLEHYEFASMSKEIKGLSYYLVIPEHNARNKSLEKFKRWIIEEMNNQFY
ncbi:LysR family transcriptional regulator [Vibrio splendidus]|uniref:LysR substrate-binding domain-containing protein n=1 Tax=Vibrio splendidus TaxID=29497 RepID=UPI000C83ED05|nr:LysR substrate-binding domain-containing protein [Vibrio splendidus]MCC5520101.1 LysR family transcriptional regulator [Vibrio splendidus]PMN26569.1 LysR family transcriptional regulator [Vibrio splendidus]